MHEPMVIRLPTSLHSALIRRHFLPGGLIILIHHMSLASTYQHFLKPQYQDVDLPNQLLFYMSKHAGQSWKPLANLNKKHHVNMETGGWDQYFIKRINILHPPQSDLSLCEVTDGVHNARTRRN